MTKQSLLLRKFQLKIMVNTNYSITTPAVTTPAVYNEIAEINEKLRELDIIEKREILINEILDKELKMIKN